MKHINNFKTFKQNETYMVGPGGYADHKSSNIDKFIYKINELSWLKDRFELHQDKLTEDVAKKYIDELSTYINKLHEILNKIGR